MADSPRVVLLALDGYPRRAFRQLTAPNLWRLAHQGGFSPNGGRSGLPSTTYPGFASLLTGLSSSHSGVRTTAQRDGAVPGWAGSDRIVAPTIAHVARDAGLRTAIVMGDTELQRVLRLDDFDRAWPTGASIPEGTPVDAHGYPTNAAVRPHLLEAAADSSIAFLFGHLNETDTVAHDAGPQATESMECARAADAIAGEVLVALAADWDRTLVIVTSDHDMEPRYPYPPIDPTAGSDCAGLVDDWIADCSAAWIRLSPGADPHQAIKILAGLEGVESWRWREPDRLLLLAAPGRVFAWPYIPVGGLHGSSSTARTLAIVGGGHPVVAQLARALEERSPRLWDWAPTIGAVLGLELPPMDGLGLL